MTAHTDHHWYLTDHVCRECFGRILERPTDRRSDDQGAPGTSVYRCADCGSQAHSDSHTAICCCGLTLKTGKDAGLRCQVADVRRPDFPSEIVARPVSL